MSAIKSDGSGKRYLGSTVYSVPESDGGSETLESAAWDEGRIFFDVEVPVDSTGSGLVVVDSIPGVGCFRDCWYVTDHIGNVRSVVDISSSLASPQVVERNDYLPYGTRLGVGNAVLESNHYRLGGKEEQTFGSLDLGKVDFGARMYDPFTARWTKTDNAAAQFPNYGSFVYCGSNPISNKEIDGDVWDTVIDAAFMAYDAGMAIYHGVKGNHEAAKQSLKNVGEDLLFAAIPGATVAVAKGAKALKNVDRMADARRVAKDYSKAAESMNQGREFEKLILEKVGLKKNTRIFASKTVAGESINVIPDAVTNKYIIEIKHVVKQSYTKQIQGEVKAAKETGKQFVLFVNKDTKLTESLLNMEKSGQITVIRDWKELLALTSK